MIFVLFFDIHSKLYLHNKLNMIEVWSSSQLILVFRNLIKSSSENFEKAKKKHSVLTARGVTQPIRERHLLLTILILTTLYNNNLQNRSLINLRQIFAFIDRPQPNRVNCTWKRTQSIYLHYDTQFSSADTTCSPISNRKGQLFKDKNSGITKYF